MMNKEFQCQDECITNKIQRLNIDTPSSLIDNISKF